MEIPCDASGERQASDLPRLDVNDSSSDCCTGPSEEPQEVARGMTWRRLESFRCRIDLGQTE
jgi:hypothetical protein